MSEAIELTDGSRWMPVERAEHELDLTARDARRVAKQLKTQIGKRVLLFGGGSACAWVMTLREVRLTSSVNDSNVNGRKMIHVRLAGRNSPVGGRTFEPLLGSWWIAVRMPKKTRG